MLYASKLGAREQTAKSRLCPPRVKYCSIAYFYGLIKEEPPIFDSWKGWVTWLEGSTARFHFLESFQVRDHRNVT